MKFSFDHNSETILIDLTPAGSGKSYRCNIGDKTFEIEIIRTDIGRLDLLIDGKRVTAYVSSENTKRWVTVNGQTFVLKQPAAGARSRGHGQHHAAGALRVTAPMPGQVRAVNVSEGEAVTKGQTLLVLEAMKMEIRVQAPMDGIVKKLSVKQGQTVEREQVLVELQEN
jgi:biotin carboxyl carrier protein